MSNVQFIVLLHHKKIEDERINTKNYRLSEKLQLRDIHERPDGRSYSWYCGIATGYRIRYSIWRNPRERYHHRHCGRFHHLRFRRYQGADRWSHWCLYRHHIWYCQQSRVRLTGPSHRHHAGRCDTHRLGCFPSGSRHQVHPLPHHHRLYRRYCRHHLHHTDGRCAGSYPRSSEQYGRSDSHSFENTWRLCRQVDLLLPEPEHVQPLELHNCHRFFAHHHLLAQGCQAYSRTQ